MTRQRLRIGPLALAATLDLPGSAPRAALLLVSGGNEIRAGGFAGQAWLAAALAAHGLAVLRFDAPGIGDSPGENGGFATRGPALAAAADALRGAVQPATPLLIFGNCDAATLIALEGQDLGARRWLLANPWVIESGPAEEDGEAPQPSAAAIRARYLARLARPGALLRDLLSGGVDFRKLAGGLRRIGAGTAGSPLAARMAGALATAPCPVDLLLATRDTTAREFLAQWQQPSFAAVRSRGDVTIRRIDSASHSFADDAARSWLLEAILSAT